MANKLSIEEQAAQLTEEEKKKILKIGKSSTTIGAIILALMGLWGAFGTYLLYDPPLGVDMGYYTKMFLGIMAGEVIGFAAIVAVSIIVKVKYPFYSDKKYSYIKKLYKK